MAKALITLPNGRFWAGADIHMNGMNTDDAVSGILLGAEENYSSFYYQGNIYYDSNQNGSFDLNEQKMALGNILINTIESGYIPFEGEYGFLLSSGIHNLSYQAESNWQLTSTPSSYTINAGVTSPTTGFDFGIYPINMEVSLDPRISTNILRCFETSTAHIYIFNDGTQIDQGYFYVEMPAEVSNINVIGMTPDSIVGNRYYFDLENQTPGSGPELRMNFTNPGTEAIGNDLTFYTKAYSMNENGMVVDSFESSFTDFVQCSYDPNDKLVNPRGIGEEGYTLFDTELTYTIRFQNTGNGYAYRVRLVDTLDNQLDWESFELLQSSHPLSEVRRVGGIVEFIFDPINLPYESIDELGSQGFVSFRIQPLPGLAENSLVENSAAIYFDFNPPIFTNSTQTTYVSMLPVSTENPMLHAINALLIPNPFKDQFTLALEGEFEYPLHLELHRVNGQLVGDQELASPNSPIYWPTISNGIYWLKISDAKGKYLGVLKAVKME